ncbi:MAG: hypothetical protein ACE361_24480 [Aureliella sp.]
MDESEQPRSFTGAALDQNGKIRVLGRHRAVVLDVLDASKTVPSFPVERWFDVADLAESRSRCPVRISWVTLFAKAYALAALDHPELRRFVLTFPILRWYQSRYSVISVAVSRDSATGEQLYFGRLRWPEDRKLPEIQKELDEYAENPVEQMFRQQLTSSLVPKLFRRMGWWWRTNIRPSQRARRLGTASLSVLAGQGCYNRLHPSPLTSSLSYGPIEDTGRMWVTLQCDHRIIDGAVAAKAINRIEFYLNGEVLSELKSL